MALQLIDIDLNIEQTDFLTNINLEFSPGAFNVLLGRTLAGKTSLMRVIAGLEKPNNGKVVLNGTDITALPVQQRNVSMVYQQFINYPHMSVWDNIASPLQLAKVKPQEIKRRVEETAELLQITPFLQRLPLALSGGQQQRCAMARALVKDAQIILFDEPLVNLDYKLRESLRLELKRITQQRDSIAIYATTEAHEALALGGQTTLLHEGKVLQSGPALTQFHNPVDLNAADLYHEPPLNRVAISEQVIVDNQINSEILNNQTLLDSGDYTLGIRPDHLSLVPTSNDDIKIEADIDLAEISASETYLHVSFSNKQNKRLNWVLHLNGIHTFENQQKIDVFIAKSKLFVFDPQGNVINAPQHIFQSQTAQECTELGGAV